MSMLFPRPAVRCGQRKVSSSIWRPAALALVIAVMMAAAGGDTDARGGQRESGQVSGENEAESRRGSVATWRPSEACDASQQGDRMTGGPTFNRWTITASGAASRRLNIERATAKWAISRTCAATPGLTVHRVGGVARPALHDAGPERRQRAHDRVPHDFRRLGAAEAREYARSVARRVLEQCTSALSDLAPRLCLAPTPN